MKEPRSVEDWKTRIRESGIGEGSGFRILSREVRSSTAYLDLTMAHREMLHIALDQVSYESKKRSRQKQGAKNRTILRNATVYLPQNLCKARGIKSPATISEGRKRLVEVGFLDVLATGSVHSATVFTVSERWRHYPNGPYQSQDKRLPGASLYGKGLQNPDHPVNQRRSKSLRSKNERKPYSKNERSEINSASKNERRETQID